MHDGNTCDSKDESNAEEGDDIEGSIDCTGRENGGTCIPEVGKREEESEDEEEEFYDAFQRWSTPFT